MSSRLDRPSLLQIATRIHQALLRTIGTGIDVGAMLRQQDYATEIIFLCRACSDPELQALGEDFESRAPTAGGVPAAVRASARVRRRRGHRVVRVDPRRSRLAPRATRRRFDASARDSVQLCGQPARPATSPGGEPRTVH